MTGSLSKEQKSQISVRSFVPEKPRAMHILRFWSVYFVHMFMLCVVSKWMVILFVLCDKSPGVELIKNHRYAYRLILLHHVHFSIFFSSALFCGFFLPIFLAFFNAHEYRLGNSVFNFFTRMTDGPKSIINACTHWNVLNLQHVCFSIHKSFYSLFSMKEIQQLHIVSMLMCRKMFEWNGI